MDIKKNRKETPCWFEKNGGCLKPHCVYLHQIKKTDNPMSAVNVVDTSDSKSANQDWANRAGTKYLFTILKNFE